jgi:hypothetical protein
MHAEDGDHDAKNKVCNDENHDRPGKLTHALPAKITNFSDQLALVEATATLASPQLVRLRLTCFWRGYFAFRFRCNQFPFFEFAAKMVSHFARVEIEECTSGGKVLEKNLTYRISESSG